MYTRLYIYSCTYNKICLTETVKIALLLHDLCPLAAALISDVDQSNARYINLKEEG